MSRPCASNRATSAERVSNADGFLQFIEHGLELAQLTPLTPLLVWTRNSLYRLIVTEGCHVLLQGGSLFPERTPAHIDGARGRGTRLRMGWIGVGLAMEFRVGGKPFVTSPVVAIATDAPASTVPT